MKGEAGGGTGRVMPPDPPVLPGDRQGLLRILRTVCLGSGAVFLAVFCLYWLKGIIGFEISKSINLNSYFPFKYVAGIVTDPNAGDTVVADDFEAQFVLCRQWASLWSREQGKVRIDHDFRGLQGSRCLLVRSDSRQDWSFPYRKFIKVAPGDRFYYEAYGNLQGGGNSAAVDIVSFDAKRTVLDYRYQHTPLTGHGTFAESSNVVTVGPGVAYISIRITGVGVGVSRIDNITLKKL